MKRIICLFMVIILVFAVLGCSKQTDSEVGDNQAAQTTTPTVTQEAPVDKLPDFVSVDLLGNKVTQDIFKDSKLTIVTLWGTF
jgi:PBP1b-binding outer membrane lipoprotein LpoB